MTLTCPYCNRDAQQATGADIYPHRPDLAHKKFYRCSPCGAYVGCHKDGRPLGRLANADLRRAKQLTHAKFDPLWKSGQMSRSAAYRWLADQLGIPGDECHIGMFDIDRCRAAYKAVTGVAK